MRKSTVVIFDATRLVARSLANTPAGIDRVALNYLLYFIGNPRYEFVCVAYHKGQVRYVDKDAVEKLAHELSVNWVPSNDWAASKRVINNYIKLNKNRKLYQSKSPIGNLVCTGEIQELTLLEAERLIYVNVAHLGLHDEAYLWALKNNLGAEIVLLIHDLIPITHSEYTRDGEKEKHIERVNGALDFADLILVNSKHTESELVEYAQINKMRLPEVRPLYIGVEPFEQVEKPLIENSALSNQDYYVVLGTIEPRKNHLLLLNIWRDLVENKVENIPKLVLIGKRGWCNENIIAMLDRCDKIKPHILELSDVPDHQLLHILKNSKALLFPSFVEGWGMPLIEALSLNVPVICSDLDVFRESAGDAPIFIDPLDAVSWKRVILDQEALERPEMQRKPMPTWDQHFIDLEEGLSKIVVTGHKRYALQLMSFNLGLINKIKTSIKRFLLYATPEKTVRKFLKFKRTPVQSMIDSKFSSINKLGNFLRREFL